MVFEIGFDDMEMWSKVSFQIASEGKSLMKMAFGVGLIDMKMWRERSLKNVSKEKSVFKMVINVVFQLHGNVRSKLQQWWF